MNWTTVIPLPQDLPSVDYQSEILLAGSCFSQEIGKKLQRARFNAQVNPYGIVFHPTPLLRGLSRALNAIQYTEEHLFRVGDNWFSEDHQGMFSGSSKEGLLENLNESREALHHKLTSSSVIILTLGTAWGYRHTANGNVVANCHKASQSLFSKECSTAEILVKEITEFIDDLVRVNPTTKVVFTVSPVRHWKDGATANQLSKSTLVCAIHEVIGKLSCCHYFPAYEIVMDELRDYRFYKPDMLHPNEVAVDYIWRQFISCTANEQVKRLAAQIEKKVLFLEHKDDSEEHKAKCAEVEQEIAELLKT